MGKTLMNSICLENISFFYTEDDAEAGFFLKDISFGINSGKVLGIFGPTASGKTTLIYLICGILKPSIGRVLIDGEGPSQQKAGWKEVRKRLAVSFQFPEDMFFKESVSEEFWNLLRGKGFTRNEAASLAYKALEWAGLDSASIYYKHPLYLSQGEQRRVSIALVRAQDSECIIMDDPTVGLECKSKRWIIEKIIHCCHQEGKIGIIASHDTSTLLPLVDQGIIIKGGRLILQGDWDVILSKPDCLTSSQLSLPPLAELALKLKNAEVPVCRIWKDLDQATEDINGLIP